MHTLENTGFLQMVVLLKQPLYGQILVELVENENDCRILLDEDIGFKHSQIESYVTAKTFNNL